MDNNNEKDINRLNFENILWFLFIVVSALNIYADELEIDFLKTNNKEKDKTANEIYLLVIIVVLLIYSYFTYRNYKQLEQKNPHEEDYFLYQIRLLGASLLVAGMACITYYQVQSMNKKK